jgi:hypothetical protein
MYLTMLSSLTDATFAFFDNLVTGVLEQVLDVVDAEATALEHLQLGVQPFHESTTLPLAEVVRNQVKPGVEQL